MLYLNTHIQEVTPKQLDDLIQLLPLQRREQVCQYKLFLKKKESTLAYLELVRGLKKEYQINDVPSFAYSQQGKPYFLSHPHIHFNLSHCPKAVGCIIHSSPCGLDIEQIRPISLQLIRYCMNLKEQEKIFSSQRPEIEFIRIWTQKEAVLKLKGTGIANHLKEALDPHQIQGIKLCTQEYLEEGFIISYALQDNEMS